MCKKTRQPRYSGFFSLDAAIALLIAVFAYVSLSLILSSAAASSSSGAHSVSSRLLSLRLSSLIMDEAGAESGGFGEGGYAKIGELDAQRLSALDLGAILSSTGRNFASVSLFSSEGRIFFSQAGQLPVGAEVFCTKRLALLSGEMARLEVCVS